MQSGVFGATELGFSGISENLGDAAPFAGRDAVVKIFKDPIQPSPEGTTDAGFAGTHEAD
jgi:hypothetical protein